MMLWAIPKLTIVITPVPVFALNQNIQGQIPTEEFILNKYKLPKNYILVGLRSQVLSIEELKELNQEVKKEDKECVAFFIDGLYPYSHPFSYSIPLPISPLEWFAIIRYAAGYIGSNMHPIVSCLTNAVPCFSLDNWGATDFWGNKKASSSSKVYDVLKQYGLEQNWAQIENGKCNVSIIDIISSLKSFPIDQVREASEKRYQIYDDMMQRILSSISK